MRSDVSSGLGSYSSAQHRTSRQAPQYYHIYLFLLFAVAHVLSRLQLLSVLGPVPTHTHTHILQLDRSHDSWIAKLHVRAVGATSARAHCSCESIIFSTLPWDWFIALTM